MDPSSSSSVTLSNSEWLLCIREDLDRARQREQQFTAGDEICIFRVPGWLRGRGIEENDYIPQVVSIGPYHYDRQQLRNMEIHKKRALDKMLQRNSQDVKIYLDGIKELEQKVRGCYDQEIDLGSPEFVLMMVLDGCFLIEIIRGCLSDFPQLGYSESDPIFTKKTVMNSIVRDMILLENQIPFFILNHIWDLQSHINPETCPLLESCLKFFVEATLIYLSPKNDSSSSFNLIYHGARHLFDVCRRTFLSSVVAISIPPVQPQQTTGNLPILCVTELRETGVKFKNDREISFHKGVLRLPRLFIDNRSKHFYVNLIVFEECCFDGDKTVAFYFNFMCNLIKTSKDVGHLKKRGIIEHLLGNDDEVADFFKIMGRHVNLSDEHNHLGALITDVDRYCKQKYPRYLASLKGYCKRNGSKLITAPAVIVQTFYAVYGYHRQKK